MISLRRSRRLADRADVQAVHLVPFVASFAAAMIPARGGTTHGWLVLAPARHLLKPERPAGMVGASGDARRPRGMASRCYHAGDELRPRAWAALLRDGGR